MKTFKNLFIMLALVFFCTPLRAQTPVPQVPQDTSAQKQMPMLEIPEITIMGKKAITLPFARKGEIYDVNVYQAPPPDSSILLPRPEMPLPFGNWNSYRERLSPWKISAGASLGSYSSGTGEANVSYAPSNWEFTASGGGSSTQGHVSKADGNLFRGELGANSILSTDNDFMRSLRFLANIEGEHDTYGMFGIPNIDLRRRRDHVLFSTGLSTLQREGTTVDFQLRTNLWSVTDAYAKGDSDISVAEPELSAAFATMIGHFLFGSSMRFLSASLDYNQNGQSTHPVQSPSLVNFAAHLGWKLTDGLSVEAGFIYGQGSGSDGSSKTMLLPTGKLVWEIEPGKEGAFWYQPELDLQSYDSLMRYIPYLEREAALLPFKSPARFGFSYWFNNKVMTLELTASYAQPSGRGVVLANAGRLSIGYLDANESKIEANGTFLPASAFRFRYQGTLERANESSGDSQLPMTPPLDLKGTFEYDLPQAPVTLAFGGNFRGKENVDLAGTRTLDPVLLFNASASTTVFPRFIIAARLENLTNVTYQWWEGYTAPGINFRIEARTSF